MDETEWVRVLNLRHQPLGGDNRYDLIDAVRLASRGRHSTAFAPCNRHP